MVRGGPATKGVTPSATAASPRLSRPSLPEHRHAPAGHRRRRLAFAPPCPERRRAAVRPAPVSAAACASEGGAMSHAWRISASHANTASEPSLGGCATAAPWACRHLASAPVCAAMHWRKRMGAEGASAVTAAAFEGSQASAGEDSLLLKNGDAPASRGSSTRRVLSLVLGEKNYSLIPTSALV